VLLAAFQHCAAVEQQASRLTAALLPNDLCHQALLILSGGTACLCKVNTSAMIK
jgi:hypothetical protein